MTPNQLKLLLDNGYTRNIFKHCDLYTNDDYRQYFYLNSDHYMPVVVNISISQKQIMLGFISIVAKSSLEV